MLVCQGEQPTPSSAPCLCHPRGTGRLDASRLRCPKNRIGDPPRLGETCQGLGCPGALWPCTGRWAGRGPAPLAPVGCGMWAPAAGSSRAGSYINSPSGSRAQPGKGALVLLPLLFPARSAAWGCCHSLLSWEREWMGTVSGAMTWHPHLLPCLGRGWGGQQNWNGVSMSLALSWEQGAEQGRFPPREAGAYCVSLMISNEQLPLVSPLISEYQ